MTISRINLAYEYEAAAFRAGLARERIRQAQANALETAFLSPDEKAKLRAELGSEKNDPDRRTGDGQDLS